jgi:hypothetical protein
MKFVTICSILISKSLSIFKTTMPDNLSCPIQFLKQVFSLLNDEKFPSHSQEQTDILYKILSNSFIDENAI